MVYLRKLMGNIFFPIVFYNHVFNFLYIIFNEKYFNEKVLLIGNI